MSCELHGWARVAGCPDCRQEAPPPRDPSHVVEGPSHPDAGGCFPMILAALLGVLIGAALVALILL